MSAGHEQAAGRWLIRGARPLGGQRADILIDGQVIVDVRPSRSGGGQPEQDVAVIDADGLIALPGLVDLHTHLREPGREDAETVQS
ncbi:MAG: dihydroorotase, partial [Streptosporangiaceae bacterium]